MEGLIVRGWSSCLVWKSEVYTFPRNPLPLSGGGGSKWSIYIPDKYDQPVLCEAGHAAVVLVASVLVLHS